MKMNRKPEHKGSMEYIRFADRRDGYYEGVEKIRSLDYELEELLEHFPAFIGHMTLSRFLGLYELQFQHPLG